MLLSCSFHFVFFFPENRPAHKGYNKLSAKEDSRTSAEVHSNQDILDNESGIAANNGNAQTNGNPGLMDSDNESTFTDLDYEDGGFSDDSDYEEALTCNVCDRTFSCPKQLSAHKQKKRHFGCSACDSLFPSLMALEHHKEEFEHWSDDDDICTDDSDEDDDTVISEECERLL
uniref:C2H2-type domain-containing protein n=1 Tax=Dendroctonus ponderosae TaxID=77166 RepID=A0AAR5PQU3_DENPD